MFFLSYLQENPAISEVWKPSFQSGLFHAQGRREVVHTGEESQQTGPAAFLPLWLL